jgi:predicted transcriptional regulator
MQALTDAELIDRLGGSTRVARLCGISPQAVSVWRRRGIPLLRRKLLALEHPELVAQAQERAAQATATVQSTAA